MEIHASPLQIHYFMLPVALHSRLPGDGTSRSLPCILDSCICRNLAETAMERRYTTLGGCKIGIHLLHIHVIWCIYKYTCIYIVYIDVDIKKNENAFTVCPICFKKSATTLKEMSASGNLCHQIQRSEASPLWYCVSTLVAHPGGEDQPQESNNQENRSKQVRDWKPLPTVLPHASNWLFDASNNRAFQTASPKKISTNWRGSSSQRQKWCTPTRSYTLWTVVRVNMKLSKQ